MSYQPRNIALALLLIAGAAGIYWSTDSPAHRPAASPVSVAAAAEHVVLYYRDPNGAPLWSAVPKKDAQGRDYIAVQDNEDVSFDPKPEPPKAAAGERKILYYRNPMGLPDVSPVPKKDSMGMNYIPVYADEDKDEGASVKISLDKIQRSGVRTEIVATHNLARPIRAIGTVKYDERRLTSVTLRVDGYIEDLFVNATGQFVRSGEPLFRVYSKDIQIAQSDLIVAAGVKASVSLARDQAEWNPVSRPDHALTKEVRARTADKSTQSAQARLLSAKPVPTFVDRALGLGYQSIQGNIQRLRNLGVPESRIEEVRSSGVNPRTIDWPSPATGTVIDKRVVNGQQVSAGAELYRIADLSQVWVIAEVAESDLAAIKLGMPASVTLRAYPNEAFGGSVTFIYPDIRQETRTARVRVELPNPDGRVKTEMYADVVFHADADAAAVVAIPDSALIDSGTRQVVLIARGEGRFEPRPVKVGRRGDGFVEVLEGIRAGEEVVTSATFLIDAESNLRAALKSFTRQEPPK